MSSVLISSELSGCEVTQFAVAATNQNEVGRDAQEPTMNPVTTLVIWRDGSPSSKPVLIGHSRGKLTCYTANQQANEAS